jgi:NADPH-dependent curcumin reductase CurA
MVQNKSLVFNDVPAHTPVPGIHLSIQSLEFDLNQEIPAEDLSIEVLYFSLDPYMRSPSTKPYSPAYTLGEPIKAYVLVQVLRSNTQKYSKGYILFGQFNVEEYNVVSKAPIGLDIVREVETLTGVPFSIFLVFWDQPV